MTIKRSKMIVVVVENTVCKRFHHNKGSFKIPTQLLTTKTKLVVHKS